MKLPNSEQAVIPAAKLEGYSLNPEHPEGRHKAVVFQAALGIGPQQAPQLRAALKQALAEHEAIPTAQTPYGQKYRIDFTMDHQGHTCIVRSIWIVRNDENFPRLVTCYIP